ASVEARNLQKAFKLARMQEKKHFSQQKEEELSNNPYIKEKNHEMIVKTAITEPPMIGTELDRDTKMEPVISRTEITSISPNLLSTLYNQTKVSENTSQAEKSDSFTA
ncbi:9951_t:CDS:2, partial [Ambispora leptoticha]